MTRLDDLRPDQARALFALVEEEYRAEASAAGGPGQAWAELARPEQRPPDGSWRTWLILSGRGWGKTRTGAETIAG